MKVEYRHPTEADIEAMTDIINRSSCDLKMHEDSSVELIRAMTFEEKDYDPTGFLLGFVDSEAVAYGGSLIQKSRQKNGSNDAYINLFVIPEWRGKGLEKHLMNFTFNFLRSKGIVSAKYMAAELSGWRNHTAMELGMKDIRHGYLMVCDNEERTLNRSLPDDYVICHKMFYDYSDHEVSEFVIAFNDSFADHWNFSPTPVERFIKVRDMEKKIGEREYRISLAKKGDEIAGVCYYEINTSNDTQKKAGWVNILGVRKTHRRLGLGQMLLANAMDWLWEQGMETIHLWMEAENSKALDLYLSLGYRVDQESIIYELAI